MTPAARLAAAIGVLDAWRGGDAAEALLTRWARGARYAGAKDRAAVRDIVYDILRCRGSAAALGGGEEGRALAIGWARLRGQEVPPLFSGEGHGPPPLSEEERAHLARDLPVPPPHVDIPEWLRPGIAARAEEPERLFAAMAARAPLWLRVALRRGSRDAAIAALSEDGLEARASELCATALEVTGHARRLRQARAYFAGLVEVQDLSAQRAVASVPWPASGTILDFCAGGGGKALAIADATATRVAAHDIDANRMSDLPPRARRAGVEIAVLPPGQAGRHAPYAAVLCDVPCSGSGTWRRDPEVKWRLTPEGLADLTRRQAAILDAASDLVAADGRLVYMTCSLLRRENEDQIEAFLGRHAGWSVEASTVDTPLTASDGFFTALLARKP